MTSDMDPILFPFVEYWWLFLAFTAMVLLLLAFDLVVLHRKPHATSFREAALSSAVWILLALGFGWAFHQFAEFELARNARLLAIPGFDPVAAARQSGLEFLTGFVIEKALSVDNMFIFVLVFRYFAVPPEMQHRVLFFGILGALVFRAAFIAAGSAVMANVWISIVFGLFLIYTGIKMLTFNEAKVAPDRTWFIRAFRRIVPVTQGLHGGSFFVRAGRSLRATPLFLALLSIEISDVVFAIDSVPAIFAITREPLIVFTSNVFAILGLRALYFLLAGAVDRFHLLKYALSVVLVFVGLKMAWLNEAFGGKFPVEWSLAIITGAVGTAILLSLVFPRTEPDPLRAGGTEL